MSSHYNCLLSETPETNSSERRGQTLVYDPHLGRKKKLISSKYVHIFIKNILFPFVFGWTLKKEMLASPKLHIIGDEMYPKLYFI